MDEIKARALEGINGYNLVKHSWRGRYKRLMSVSTTAITTYNPNTLEMTNYWEYKDIAGVSINRKATNEITLCVPKARGKNPTNMNFESVYLRDILTDIYSQYRKLKMFHEGLHRIHNGEKICTNNQTRAVRIVCTPAAIEVWCCTAKKSIACYFYKDIHSFRLLSNVFGGFAIVTKFGSRMHAYKVDSVETLVSNAADRATEYLALKLYLGDPLTLEEYLTRRLGVLGCDNSLMMFSTYSVHKLSPRYSQPVRRIIGVSEDAVVEHDPSTYRVVSVKAISRIYGFYRSPDNPQEFGIEWCDGLPRVTRYLCAERDYLLATFLDTVRAVNANVHIHSIPTDYSQHFSPLKKFVDEDIEVTCMKLLTNNFECKIENVIRFNINIPYTGFQHAHAPDHLFGEKKEKAILGAISALLAFEETFPILSPAAIENIFFAMKRLFSSKPGFECFSVIPNLCKRIGSLVVNGFRRKDNSINYAASEMMISLIIPLHPNNDLFCEQQNKMAVLASRLFIKSLLAIVQENITRKTGALVTASLLDFFTFIICPPFSNITDGEQFDVVVELITDLGCSLFKLFSYSSPSIVKSIGMIIKSIIEESKPDICDRIQNFALSEGVLPKHLHMALFSYETSSSLVNTKILMNRQLSRQLLVYWFRDCEIARSLLERSIPLGLRKFLYTTEKASVSALYFPTEREEIKLDIKDPKELEVFIRENFKKVEKVLQHWYHQMSTRIGVKQQEVEVASRTVVFRPKRENKPSTENWDLFYEKFYQDHYSPDLIWNHKTREDLRNALESEIRGFDVDKELVWTTRFSWNFEDFEVSYTSLRDELEIGGLYLAPLFEKDEFKLASPATFFNDLYHVFLQSESLEKKYSCIKAMTKIYQFYHLEIGQFTDVYYIFHLLKTSSLKVERDLLLKLLREMCRNKENARKVMSIDGVPFLIDLANLAHLHSNRAVVPLQTLMLEGSYTSGPSATPEWFIQQGDSSIAYSLDDIKSKYEKKVINEKTKIWAQGMEGWTPLEQVVQLKWTIIDSGQSLMNESDIAITVLNILLDICHFFPSVDKSGGIIRPLPRAKRLLSDVRSLPHICQLLITFDPVIVEKVSLLVNDVMIENPVLPRLFISGLYFFIMMYTGSNVLPVTKLLKATHLRQGFNFEDKKRNDALANSILSPLLPEAMIACLEAYDDEKFSQTFLGEFDTPEVIWSNEMRRYMMEKIAVHLADFTSHLKANIKSVYTYCPIPTIEYEQLKDELFCGKYYLRNLCDTTRFPNWTIDDPIQTLRDILNAWKDEVNKKPPSMSLDEAYEALGLPTGVKHEDNRLRTSYLKLASKYHPDKNPDGREIFEKAVKAYEFLCSKQVKNMEPSMFNIVLILKSQSILFVNHSKSLDVYKYPGYPMLIQTILMELEADNLFDKGPKDSLLLPAVELAHHTIACSSLNAEELRRENGIEVLQKVFDRCINLITFYSKPSDSHVMIIENVIRCFLASCRFEGFINIIIEIPRLFCNLSHILMHQTNLTALCCTTVECIISLCSNHMVQIQILNYSLIYHLIYFIFYYDYTLFESGVQISHENSQQQQYNELAKLSFQGLAIMSASALENQTNVCITTVLNKLLTEYIVSSMVRISPHDLIKSLNSNVETPYMKWNNGTRNQLKSILERIRKYNPDDDNSNHIIALTFEFDEHKDELIIGGVFIEILNRMPSFIIEHPVSLYKHIINFIQERSQILFSSLNSGAPPDSRSLVVKHLTEASLSLYIVLSNYPVYKNVQLHHYSIMLSFFLYQDCNQIQMNIIKVISVLVRDTSCVTCIAEAKVLGYLNLCAHILPSERITTLSIFQPLFANSSIVRECIQKGTLLYLLNMFCFDKEIDVRRKIIEIFAKLISDRLSGPRVKILINKFFPNIFIDAILDDSQAAVLLFESKQENPELIWNDETREHVASTVKKMTDSLFIEQCKNPAHLWQISDEFSCFENEDPTATIAGVDINRYLVQPTWSLRHPKEFLIGLMDRLLKIYSSPVEVDSEHLVRVTDCLCLFLEAQPLMADQIPSFGYIANLINIIEKVKENPAITKSALRVQNLICRNKFCVQDMCTSDKWIKAIVKIFEDSPDCADIAAECLDQTFSHAIPTCASQTLHSNSVNKMVNSLELPFTEVKEPNRTRAHLANALQCLEKDPLCGNEISEILNQSKIWKQYRNQKHDLFIENKSSLVGIAATPAGFAGYLTAAHNSASTSYTNVNTMRVLTSDVPPTPTDKPAF